MIPRAASFGHSFKGAFAYYLHDKRPEAGGPRPATAERVEWAETRNLAHDDPAYCQSVMIATARNAEKLKAAAGLKKSKPVKHGPVFAYSLAWHPENETIPDRAGMIEAVEASIKALKAEKLQAVIICHTDTAHPHVHVILNRVDPETGKQWTGDEYKILRKFREDYERTRGQIVTKTRDERLAEYAQERRAKPGPDFEKAANPSAVPVQPRKRAPAPERPAPIQTKPQPPEKTQAAALAEQAAAQKVRHKQEWADLAAANKARRSAAYAERIDFKAIAAQHRADTRPEWSELGRTLAAERKAFRFREKGFGGIVDNALALASIRIGQGQTQGRGILAETFRLMLDKHARHAAFAGWEQGEKAKLAATQNTALQGRFATAKAGQAQKLAKVRTIYDRDRAALITRQDLERARVGDEWKRIYAERERRAEVSTRREAIRDRMPPPWAQRKAERDRQAIDSQARAPGQKIPRPQQQEPQTVKPQFEHASQLPIAKQQPEPSPRVSVSRPEPAPSPAGVPVPPARRMDPVPESDRAKAYAATLEGQKATAPQKAAPDALRRAYQPPEKVAPAKEQTREADKPAVRSYWDKATAAPAPEQPKPAERRSYWDKDATKEKPAAPAPERGKTRDEWERDR